jgi:hypothetical protein
MVEYTVFEVLLTSFWAHLALKLRMQMDTLPTPDSSLVSHSNSVVRLSTGPASPESGQEIDETDQEHRTPMNELNE